MLLVTPVLAECGVCGLDWTFPVEEDYTPYNYSLFMQVNDTPEVNESVVIENTTPIFVHVPDITEVTGSVEFLIQAGGSVMSREIYIMNSVNKNKDRTLIPVHPMGRSDPVPLIPGDFVALMPDGNGGHAEWRYFNITVGDEKRVVFLGHAISIHHRETPTVEPTPTPTPDPDTCYPVEFETVFGGHTCSSQEVTYILNNPNREVKTVYIYATENYLTSNCQRGTVGCCIDTETTRVLPTSSWAAYPGQSEYTVQIGRMDGHVSYQFRTETMCPR
ncbi:MAG TPA: hypothetical protein VMV55_00210 [Methanoregula sp.]|nr:hypothetical protein [Methanoregula sp.]